MTNRFWRYLLFHMVGIGLGLMLTASAWAVCVQDDVGRQVCVGKVNKVVSLAPHATEMLDFIGAGSRIVGIDTASDYPSFVRQLPKVGDLGRVDIERLLAMKPDLIVAWQSGLAPGQVAQLEKLGFAVFVSEPVSISMVAGNMQRLASLLSLLKTASVKIQAWQDAFEMLKYEHHTKSPPLRVFYQIGSQPLMTLGGRHVVSQVLNVCGGHNVFAPATMLAFTVGVESVVAALPDVILSSGSARDLQNLKAFWAPWRAVPAVQRQAISVVEADWLLRNGPRLLQAAQQVCSVLDQARDDTLKGR